MSWRNTLGAHLRRMTVTQATASLRRIQLRVGVAEQPEVERLTGLPPSKVTPFVVSETCARLQEFVKENATRDNLVRQFDPTEQVD